jgi:hypothetical protein
MKFFIPTCPSGPGSISRRHKSLTTAKPRVTASESRTPRKFNARNDPLEGIEKDRGVGGSEKSIYTYIYTYIYDERGEGGRERERGRRMEKEEMAGERT